MVLSHWLRGLGRRSLTRRLRAKAQRARNQSACEFLEDRVLLTNNVVVVDVTHDTTSPNDGNTTLREAVDLVRANPDLDTIEIAVGPASSGNAIELTQGEIVLDVDVRVTATDSQGVFQIRVSDDPDVVPSRIFNVSAEVTLENLMLADSGHESLHGGAIYNSGDLTLDRVTLVNNTAYLGGGVYSGVVGAGANLTVVSSTFSNNHAANGGAIHSIESLSIVDSTIANNSSGVSTGNTAASVRNSILAMNDSFDVEGNFVSQGNNLVGVGDDSGWVSTDIVGSSEAAVDPLLGSLQANGGFGWTHQLLPGSPAIDAGASEADSDQRGALRTLDGPDPDSRTDSVATPDIGAFEFGTFFVNVSEDGTDTTHYADGRVDADPALTGDQITLRAAIQELNALAGYAEDLDVQPTILEGVIILPDDGAAVLSLQGTGEDHAATGDLDVFGNLTIRGNYLKGSYSQDYLDLQTPGSSIIASLGGFDAPDFVPGIRDRVFHVLPGSELRIDKVAIDGGYTVDDGAAFGGHGGVVLNDGGSVAIVDSALGDPWNPLARLGTGNYAHRKGGAVYTRDGDVTIANTHVGLNISRQGGAFYVESGTLTIDSESHLLDNRATVRGGAVYLRDGSVHITGGSRVENSSASSIHLLRFEEQVSGNRGGSVYIQHGSFLVDGGTEITGSTSIKGGAIYNNGDLAIVDAVVSGAAAGGGVGEVSTNAAGGAIFNNGNLSIHNSEINGGAYRGGAIFNKSGHSVKIVDSEFRGSSADDRGGAIHNNNGRVDIYGSTFADNLIKDTADGHIDRHMSGAAIYNVNIDAELNIVDSVFDGNFAANSGGAIYNNSGSVSIVGSSFVENLAYGAYGAPMEYLVVQLPTTPVNGCERIQRSLSL